jgi:hypothetical protein
MSHSGAGAGGWGHGIGASGSAVPSGTTAWLLVPSISLIYENGVGNDTLSVAYIPAPQLQDLGQGNDSLVV